jgi:hypothetical protein
MSDVAGRIIGQFAGNLEGVVAAGSGTGSSGSTASTDASAPPAPALAADAIDMMEVAGGAVAKKLIPVLLVVVTVIAAWLLLK